MPEDHGIKWQEVLKDAVQNDSIKASELRKIPHMTDCPRWDLVEFLGSVIHSTKFGSYDGGLVKYAGRLYYVNRAQIEALRPWVRWKTARVIKVTEG